MEARKNIKKGESGGKGKTSAIMNRLIQHLLNL